jgi:hypothetical protein
VKPGEIWKKKTLEPDGKGELNQVRFLKILAKPGEFIEHLLDENAFVGEDDWQVDEWWEDLNGNKLRRRIACYPGELIFRYFERYKDADC